MKRHLEIRFGRQAKMYTLWTVNMPDDDGGRFFERYIQNLSTNIDEAEAKAAEFAKKQGIEVYTDAPDTLRPIVKGEDVLRFGRYRDKRVSEITDERYLIWLFKGAALKNDSGYWVDTLSSDSPIRIAATNILLERGVVVEFNDKVMTKEKAEELKARMELNAKSEFFGQVGQKVSVKVKVERTACFDTAFGTTFVTTMRDEKDNVVVYKGKCLEIKKTDGYLDCVKAGDEFEIKGTVKNHSEYKGVKQTYIQRVKIS